MNNYHELSQCHVHKIYLHPQTSVVPRSNPEQAPAPRDLPVTPPATPTKNTTSSQRKLVYFFSEKVAHLNFPVHGTAPAPNGPVRPKALPKRGPYLSTAKIHSLDTRYRYFVSTGPHPGPLPTSCDSEPFEKGDLYVHRYTENNLQVWLLEDNGAWRSVSSGHRHPTLPKYRLNILPDSGKPNWVLRETWMTVARRKI